MRKSILALEAIVLAVLLALPLVIPPIASLLDPVGGIAGGFSLDPVSGLVLRPGGISGYAEVYYDEAGVPHVFASTDEAAFYAVGWIHASLRLFQMDVYRRVALGELSGLVGASGLDVDRTSLTLGFRDSSIAVWRHIESSPEFNELESIIKAYTSGVNDYIDFAISEGLLPPEYRILGLKPDEWSPIDTVALAKFFHLMLSYGNEDLVLEGLVERLGTDVIVELDMVERQLNVAHAPCEIATTWGDVTGLNGPYSPGIPVTKGSEPIHRAEALSQASTPLKYETLSRSVVASVLSILRSSEASNNWVISGSIAEQGKPILANDPHLALTSPSLWLAVRIESPGFRVAGVTLPGVPFVVIGRNESVAWGFTNVGSDFTDFFYYQWVDRDTYLYKGSQVDVESIEYEVLVWNPMSRSYTVETVTVEYTVHGPIIEWNGGRYAVSYTGIGPTFETVFLWKLNKASNVREALASQQYFYGPPQNMVVADVEGNIAYSPIGAYPVRSPSEPIETSYGPLENTGFLPYNGSKGEGEWLGYMDYSQLPILFNPETGYVATANSKPFDGECWRPLGWDYADRFRTQRIYQLLERFLEDGSINVQEVTAIQLDTRDLGLESVSRLIVSLMLESGKDHELLEHLMAWNARPSTNTTSTGATVALLASWFFARDVWNALYGSYDNWRFLKVEYIEKLVIDYLRGEPWVGKYFVEGQLEDMAWGALEKSKELAVQYFGTQDPARWFYGQLHYYNPDHIIAPALGYRESPAPGGPFSVNVAPPSYIDSGEGAPVSTGPSVRIVSPLHQPTILISLPGGSSGVPFSEWYDNQYESLWIKGEYHVINLELKPQGEPALIIRGGVGGG